MEGWLNNYPELLALLLVAFGSIAAALIKPLVERSARLFNDRLDDQGLVARQLSDATVAMLGRLAFWLILGAAVLGAVRILGVGAGILAAWVESLFSYLPRLIVGLVIIGIGYILAVFSSSLVDRFWGHKDQRELVAILTHWSILLIAAMTGLEHMGLDITFLSDLLLLGFGLALGGLALAFALGARPFVANLIGQREVSRYGIGQRIRIGEHEGRIVDLGSTVTVLETANGLVTLPNSLFTTESVLTLGDD